MKVLINCVLAHCYQRITRVNNNIPFLLQNLYKLVNYSILSIDLYLNNVINKMAQFFS